MDLNVANYGDADTVGIEKSCKRKNKPHNMRRKPKSALCRVVVHNVEAANSMHTVMLYERTVSFEELQVRTRLDWKTMGCSD